MLYIIARDREEGNLQGYRWCVGTSKLVDSTTHIIESVQASGEELEYVYENFVNIPRHKSNDVVKWYGDFACFIVDNL